MNLFIRLNKALVLIFLISICFTTHSFAMNVIGMTCPSISKAIVRITKTPEYSTLAIHDVKSGQNTINERLILPTGNELDALQARGHLYLTLQAVAPQFFPYMPETLMVFKLMRAQKLYRAGFKTLEYGVKDPTLKPVKLNAFYCKAMIKAIENFTP